MPNITEAELEADQALWDAATEGSPFGHSREWSNARAAERLPAYIAEVRRLREAINGALRIKDLWLPNAGAADDPEATALAAMHRKFLALTEPTEHKP